VLTIKNIFSILILSALLVNLVGCASLGRKWKNLVGGGTSSAPAKPPGPQSPSFASQPNVMTGKERKYKRVTKENFSDEQSLEENSGSLWRKEGQGSYLFSQNNLRVLGDVVNVNIEGRTGDNLSTKIKLIRTAWAKFDKPQVKIIRRVATAGKPTPDRGQGTPPPPPAQANDANNTDENKDNDKNSADNTKEKDDAKFDQVPCRIVEKNSDGSYRVKGQQTVLIGRREYKIIVTGNLRADDITADNISSTKIIDGKFDLIASSKDARNDIIR